MICKFVSERLSIADDRILIIAMHFLFVFVIISYFSLPLLYGAFHSQIMLKSLHVQMTYKKRSKRINLYSVTTHENLSSIFKLDESSEQKKRH